jgi:hypothetical protein
MTCFVYTMRNSAKPATECYNAYILLLLLLLLYYYDIVYEATGADVSLDCHIIYILYLIKFDDTFASSCII